MSKTELHIYGYSDDLVEIEGTLNGKPFSEEYSCDKGQGFVGLTSGTAIKISLGDQAEWKLETLVLGPEDTIIEVKEDKKCSYSEEYIISGPARSLLYQEWSDKDIDKMKERYKEWNTAM